MAQPELFAALATNLNAMYLGTRADERRVADRWLQKLQRESAGWSVADALLSGTTDLAPIHDPCVSLVFPSSSRDLFCHPDSRRKPLAREALVFAAITLDVKVCGDLHELAPEQQVALRGASLEHLARWGCGIDVEAPPALLKKLSLVVAALAVQTSWEGVLGYVEQQVLAPAMVLDEQERSPNFAQSCRAMKVALEILAALPEQCARKALSVSRPRREAYSRFLCLSSEGALGLVTSVAAWVQHAAARVPAHGSGGGGGGGGARERLRDPQQMATLLNEAVFSTLESWIRYCNIDPGGLAANPLFLGAFDAFNHPSLFDVAADVIVESLRTYDCRLDRNMALVSTVAPRVMGLRDRFAAATRDQDDDVALGLCRLFVEMAEAYMPLIASSRDVNQLAIVELILMCTDHPSRAVAQVPLRFWYHLARAWGRLPNDSEDGAKRRLHTLLAPLFARLARVCVIRSRRTEDDASHAPDDASHRAPQRRGGGSADDDDFSRHRSELFETLGDCAFFLGGELCLAELAAELQAATRLIEDPAAAAAFTDATRTVAGGGCDPPDAIEACLFSLRALASFVPPMEDSVVPHTMRLVLQLPAEDPVFQRARTSAAALVGAFANWLSHHPDFLEPLFQFLLAQLDVQGLTGADDAAAAAAPAGAPPPPHENNSQNPAEKAPSMSMGGSPSVAASALKRIFEACRLQLGEPVLSLRDRIQGGALSVKDELEILEGLGQIISALPDYEAVRRGTEKLAAPPAMALASIASAAETAEPRLVVAELERLTSVVRCAVPSRAVLGAMGRSSASDRTATATAPPPHPVLELVDRLWPVFEAIAERYHTSNHVVEKLCRCYKHAMRTCRRHFEPMLQRMIAHLVRHFQRSPLCSYLYAASICITEFGADLSKVPVLFEMLASFSASVFNLLKTLQDFVKHPDVVEEYFYLVARFLSYCPDPLVDSPLLGEVLRCGVVGLRLEHREAHQGTMWRVLHCFERTVSTGFARSSSHHGTASAASNVSADASATMSHTEERLQHQRAQLLKLLVEDGLGEQIASGVLGALTGDLPAYALDEGHGSLIGVLWKLRLFCPAQLAHWVAKSLQALPPRLASNDIKNDLMALVTKDPSEKEEFYDAFLVFSARCREIVNVLR